MNQSFEINLHETILLTIIKIIVHLYELRKQIIVLVSLPYGKTISFKCIKI